MTSVSARNVLAGLPSWQVAELTAEELEDRMLSLATVCSEGLLVHRQRVRARATA